MAAVTRRGFMLTGAMAAGWLLVPGARQSGRAWADDVRFAESSCAKGKKKVLVAYESLCGSTSGVAQGIGEVLCASGMSVDVLHIKNVGDISAYGGAVIGSAVKSAAWHPEAVRFCVSGQHRLKQIPVAYFSTCLCLYHDTPKNQDLARSYFDPVLKAAPEIRPAALQAFAGALDYGKLNVVVRTIMKAKMGKQGIPEGDFRDFKKIASWASSQVLPLMVGI